MSGNLALLCYTIIMNVAEITSRLRGGVIVSCQALPEEPLFGAEIGFIVFIASTTNKVSPSLTCWPTLTKGGAPGVGAR